MNTIRIIACAAFMALSSYTYAQAPLVGADADEHGCKGSAGYTYSTIRKECIQVFAQDIKLESIGEGTSTSIGAIIFDDSQKKAEVFIPGLTGTSVILNRKGSTDTWKKGEYLLTKENGVYSLKKAGKEVYRQVQK